MPLLPRLSPLVSSLNESPSEKEGKFRTLRTSEERSRRPSMKVPPKRKGNATSAGSSLPRCSPSMKVPPKRKGNKLPAAPRRRGRPLNESPSEKEGKFSNQAIDQLVPGHPSMKVPPKKEGKCSSACKMRHAPLPPSMKVPPKRKGNRAHSFDARVIVNPQ